MKKIQAKKKRDRAATELEYSERAPDDGRPAKSLLDNDDDVPILFT